MKQEQLQNELQGGSFIGFSVDFIAKQQLSLSRRRSGSLLLLHRFGPHSPYRERGTATQLLDKKKSE